MNRIENIERAVDDLRSSLAEHRLYQLLRDIDDIQTFMEYHVYAVWDFMSLLKALQQQLTCTAVPWRPRANSHTVRFINEIVWGEESDVNADGVPASHYEMYLDAMREVGADTAGIETLVDAAADVSSLLSHIESSDLPAAVQRFLSFTFRLITEGGTHRIASAFTFGREDLIPDMFLGILREQEADGLLYPQLRYYLERHIEVDGDEHGPLSLQMVSEVCGEDERLWAEAQETAYEALAVRLQLWDAIAEQIAMQQAEREVLVMA